MQYANLEQRQASSAIHFSLEHLDLVDMALAHAVAVARRERRLDSLSIALYSGYFTSEVGDSVPTSTVIERIEQIDP